MGGTYRGLRGEKVIKTTVVSFGYVLNNKNPRNYVSRKTELVSIRVIVTLD